MTLPPPPSGRWWDGTALDLTYLGSDNLTRLAQLADSPRAFYQKYVVPRLTTQLKADVQIALATTEDYALDFATRVVEYFETHWIQEQPPIPPAPPQTIPQHPASPSPPAHVQTPAAQPTFGQQDLERVRRECMDFTTLKFNEQNDAVVAQITGLREELTQITDTQRRLADSFNQMRSFLDDFMKRQQPQSVVVSPGPMSMPPAGQAYPMTMGPPPVQPQVGGYPTFTPPPAAAAPAPTPQLYPSTAQPPAAYPSTTPPAYPGTGGMAGGSSGYDDYVTGSRYPVGGSGGTQDLLPSVQFEGYELGVVQCYGKTLTWVQKKENTALLDYICLEDMITCSWRPFAARDSTIAFGFIMDVLGTGCSTEKGQKIFVEYSNKGKLQVRSTTEKVEPFTTGDVIRLELNMRDRTANFFKNDIPLPVKITMIPKVNRFYVTASGQSTRVDLLTLQMSQQATNINPAGRKEIAMDRA